MDQPNLLLIMADHLRADALGFAGNEVVRTPNIDRLAQNGVVFDNCFVQSPVCMASRAAIHTGRYPSATRVRSMGLLPPSETTLAEFLSRLGYRTGLFGKLHFTPQLHTLNSLHSTYPIIDSAPFLGPAGIPAIAPDPHKMNYGFHEAFGVEDVLYGNYRDWLRSHGQVVEGRDRPAGRPASEECKRFFECDVEPEWHPSAYIARTASEFIARNRNGRPWYGLCSFVAPHPPLIPPRSFVRPGLFETSLPKSSVMDFCSLNLPDRLVQWIENQGFQNYSPETWTALKAHYYAEVEHIDWCIGYLIDALEKSGQMENTVIALVSDHGDWLGDYGLYTKGSIHSDGLIRVPWILSGPALQQGQLRIDSLVQEIDVMPTILGLMALPSPDGVQGRDWSDSIRKRKSIAGYESIYCEMHDLPGGPYIACQTVRTKGWKLNYYPFIREGQLFDLKNDPLETINRYGDEALKNVQRELLELLIDKQAESVDPLPRLITQW